MGGRGGKSGNARAQERAEAPVSKYARKQRERLNVDDGGAVGRALRIGQAMADLKRGRIDYEDTLVRVISPTGNIDYEGIHDDNPYKRDDWTYSDEGFYTLETDRGMYVMGRLV